MKQTKSNQRKINVEMKIPAGDRGFDGIDQEVNKKIEYPVLQERTKRCLVTRH